MEHESHRHMVNSSLYKEDVVLNGHSAVWGSFYDRETRSWGYACCLGTVKTRVCPFGNPNSSADESTCEQVNLIGAGESLNELTTVMEDIQLGAELVRRFIAAVLKEWSDCFAKDCKSSCGRHNTPPTASSLQPLVDKMLAMDFEKDTQRKVEKICRLSLCGDHLGAQQAYIDLTIGNSKWVIGGISHLSVDAKAEPTQANVRTRDIKETESLLDDVVIKGSLQNFKRLLTFMEERRHT